MIRQAISPRLAMRMRLNIAKPTLPRRGDLCLAIPMLPKPRFRRCPSLCRHFFEISAPYSAARAAVYVHWRSLLGPEGRCKMRCGIKQRRPPEGHRTSAWQEDFMALSLNDIAPDFEAETTEGKIRFH